MGERIALGLTLLLVPAAIALGGEIAVPELDVCDAAVRERPDELPSYECFWTTARRLQAWDDAARRLDARLAVRPDDHRAMLYLGAIEADLNHDRAEPLYRRAIEAFAASEDHVGEVLGRVSLSMFLDHRGRHDEALLQLEAAESAALASGDATQLARIRARRGWQAYHRNDYGRAWIHFRRAEETAFPNGPSGLRAQILDGLGATSWAMGEYRHALDCYLREAEVLAQKRDPVWEASTRANIVLLASQPGASQSLTVEELRELGREAVESAVRSGSRLGESSARQHLAQVLDYPDNVAMLEQSLRLAREFGKTTEQCDVLSDLAFALTIGDPGNADRACALIDEAIDLARTRAGPADHAHALAVRADISRLVAGREEAIAAGLAALDAIERVRELQPDGSVRVAVFARWAPVYYKLAHYLLESGDAGSREAVLNLAVDVIERMRSRVLLDALDAAGAGAVGDTGLPIRAEWSRTLEQIAAVQRRLRDPLLDDAERLATLTELDRSELEEKALRDAVARADPSFARLRAPDRPGLDEIRKALDADQAVLSFHVGPDLRGPRGGGSIHTWLVVITREAARPYRLSPEPELRLGVHMFQGLLQRRDEAVERGASVLYGMLLERALNELPEEIKRLVVVPDGVLHEVPFGALRADGSGEPLAVRFRISRVPSLTIWLRWLRSPTSGLTRSVLALADPDLPSPAEGDASRRAAGAFAEYLGLGPLPHAREEAREVIRRFGGDGLLVEGAEASERLLKSEASRGYRLLHVAAHAVIDGRHPERSALVLSPGGASEDGLLQVREIVNLDLDGTVVLLSTCSSAGGPVVAGEGVVGLARAFFQAGAPAVVGTLWPLRDDEAADLAADLAAHLARGVSLGDALHATRREWIREGRPAAAWSGVVLVGNDDLTLHEPREDVWGGEQTLALIAAACLVGAAILLFRARWPRTRR